MAGMPTGVPSVPRKRSWRSAPVVLPWFMTMAPMAPAASAFATFWPNGQVPRCSSAMLPATPAKSAASQPEVLAFGVVSWRSTGTTAPVAVPPPEQVMTS
nr:hypothetical protein GCM10020092_065080 [Actinoplanes digitatis]